MLHVLFVNYIVRNYKKMRADTLFPVLSVLFRQIMQKEHEHDVPCAVLPNRPLLSSLALWLSFVLCKLQEWNGKRWEHTLARKQLQKVQTKW